MTPRELDILTRLLDCARRFRAPYRDTDHLALRSIEGAGVCSSVATSGRHVRACAAWQQLVADAEAIVAEHAVHQPTLLEAAS